MSEKKLRDAAPLIKALNIVNYAPVVANYAELNNKAKLDQFRTRLSGALDHYSLK